MTFASIINREQLLLSRTITFAQLLLVRGNPGKYGIQSIRKTDPRFPAEDPFRFAVIRNIDDRVSLTRRFFVRDGHGTPVFFLKKLRSLKKRCGIFRATAGVKHETV